MAKQKILISNEKKAYFVRDTNKIYSKIELRRCLTLHNLSIIDMDKLLLIFVMV